METMLNFLIAFGACQAFFISLILLNDKSRSDFKKYFALFLIIEGITLLERMLVGNRLIESVPHLIGISYPISFIKPPLLFFMALVLVDRTFKLRKGHILHLFPFMLILVFNLPFYGMRAEEKLEIVYAFMNHIPEYFSFNFLLSLSFFFHIGLYMIAALRHLARFKSKIKNNSLVNWYQTVLYSYFSFLLIHLLYFLQSPLGWLRFPVFNQISMLVMTFVIQAIAYKLIKSSSVFSDKKAMDINDLQKSENDTKIIKAQFEEHKVYLDDRLNLSGFAESISMPTSYVSELINQRFGCSFKKLVAQYRFQEAKSMMDQTGNEGLKLIEIAYSAGFNNKVSFYRTFKQRTGYSPSDYLKMRKKE
ncbi:MAG: helix-turn-helix domain-containing protein [Reichenbachiella sp.]|uniref:helix-turn-helix domain-containing protein n=1 Tax=Reichenbachiella sp. TaxID=2184521 RepID=UPI0032668BA7